MGPPSFPLIALMLSTSSIPSSSFNNLSPTLHCQRVQCRVKLVDKEVGLAPCQDLRQVSHCQVADAPPELPVAGSRQVPPPGREPAPTGVSDREKINYCVGATSLVRRCLSTPSARSPGLRSYNFVCKLRVEDQSISQIIFILAQQPSLLILHHQTPLPPPP